MTGTYPSSRQRMVSALQGEKPDVLPAAPAYPSLFLADFERAYYVDQYRRRLRVRTWAYGYDALDHLVSASATGGSTGQGHAERSETYSYNVIGNLTSKGGVTYTYPASGASSVRPHAVSSTSNGGAFSYDANPTPLRGLCGQAAMFTCPSSSYK